MHLRVFHYRSGQHFAVFQLLRYVSNGAADDYYKVLGVGRNATTSDIKAAYYRLSKVHHPDVNPNDENMKKFQKISEAYMTLGFPDRKRIYDVENFLSKLSGEGDSESIDHEFAAEIMELNEEVDTIDDETRLSAMLTDVGKQISADVTRMEEAFARDDVHQSRYHLNRLRYLLRTKSLIRKKLSLPD